MELRGISCISLETQSSKRKSCVVSRSFAKKVEKLQGLQESITNYCLNAAEKIRSESLAIFWVSELESSTIFSPSTFLFTISDLLEETIFSERLYFFIALA